MWDSLTRFGWTAGVVITLSGACASKDEKPFGLQLQPSAGKGGSGGSKGGNGGDAPEGSGGSAMAGEGSGATPSDAGSPGAGGDASSGAQGGTGGSARGGTGGSGARGGSSGTGATAGGAGKPSTVNLGTAHLEQIVTEAPWQIGQQTTGIAVDHDGRVYVSDEDTVYRVTGSKVEPFITAAEIRDGLSFDVQFLRIDDLDIDPDDVVYVLASGVLVSVAKPHEFEFLLDMRQYTDFYEAAHLGIAGGYTAVAKNDGLWRVAGEPENVYTAEELGWSSGCAAEDLAVAHTGTFLYQPGCNGSPLIRGHVGGGEVGVLYDTVASDDNPLEAQNFLCVARDPAGGFYVVVDNDLNHTELYHLDEQVDDRTAVRRVDIDPTLQSERETEESAFAMRYCSIAVDPSDGSVSLVTFADLWRIGWD